MKKAKIIFIVLVILMLIIFISHFLSPLVGWYGYEQYKYRRLTYGNRKESVERKVFVKSLSHSSSIDTIPFEIYIEKGYKYGYNNSKSTRFVTDSKFPFQISFTDEIGKNNISYYLINKEEYDSIDEMNIYLKEPLLKDTLLVGIQKYTNKWDSIGYIKVWDKDVVKK